MIARQKPFDCVEMKRRGAERIYEEVKDMTAEEEAAYWRERSRQFREEHERACGVPRPAPADNSCCR